MSFLSNLFYIFVIPAQAGIHFSSTVLPETWIPACAGMTPNGQVGA